MSITKVTGMMQTGTKGGDISSASPTVVDTDGDYFDITGTTNFAAFTVVAGRRFTAQFDGVLTMTHHATTLDLPGGANITTAAGDVAEFFATGTNTVQCVNYTRADGTPIALSNNSVTLAKMAGGTDGNIISFDASGDPVAIATGSDGEVLTSAGAGAPPAFEAAAAAGTTAATVQATTSGGSMDFTGIPSGTKRIDIILNEVSADGANDNRIQIGDAGGIETSGYVSKSTGLVAGGVEGFGDQSDCFIMQMGQAGSTFSGFMSLFLVDASTYTWVGGHVGAKTGTNASVQGGGSKSLSAELTQLNLSLHATDFDAGKVNIHYWQ